MRRFGVRRDGRGEKSDECSIGRVKRLIATVVGGAVGALGIGAFLARRRSRRKGVDSLAQSSLAEELRAKLAESRAAEAEATAQPEAAAEPAPEEAESDLEQRRREVHERARGSIEELGDS